MDDLIRCYPVNFTSFVFCFMEGILQLIFVLVVHGCAKVMFFYGQFILTILDVLHTGRLGSLTTSRYALLF